RLYLPSFPTRRSSDLPGHPQMAVQFVHGSVSFDPGRRLANAATAEQARVASVAPPGVQFHPSVSSRNRAGPVPMTADGGPAARGDRKSTRLNSSHVKI